MVQQDNIAEEWSDIEQSWFDAPTMDNAELPSFTADRIVEPEPVSFFASIAEAFKSMFGGAKSVQPSR